MVRKLAMSLVMASLTLGVALGAFNGDEKTPTIKEIMQKMNGKKDAPGLLKKVTDAGKGEKWDDAIKSGKELAELGKSIVKNKPPKGDAESWEKLSKKYTEHVKAIHEAAEKKDSAALNTATKALRDSCMACHTEHRPAKKGK